MAFKLFLSKKSEKEIRGLEPNNLKRVIESFEKIEKNTFIGKKLKGKLDGFYSVKVWPFRIVYKIIKNKSDILIIRVDHRNQVYKN